MALSKFERPNWVSDGPEDITNENDLPYCNVDRLSHFWRVLIAQLFAERLVSGGKTP
jgi:hypothetical protein